MAETIGAIIGYSIIGGAAISGLLYWLFKTFIEKWLSTKFSQQLEDYKHAQAIELAHMRFKTDGLMDRAVKLHQREFEILPKIWSRLVMADAHVMSVISAFQQYADVDNMSPSQLDDFLEQVPLRQWQKDELKASSKRWDYYVQAMNGRSIVNSRKIYIRFNRYLHQNGIFLNDEMERKFVAYSNLLNAALGEHEFHHQNKGFPDGRDSIKKLAKEGAAMMDELKREVRNRLRDSQNDGSGKSTTDGS